MALTQNGDAGAATYYHYLPPYISPNVLLYHLLPPLLLQGSRTKATAWTGFGSDWTPSERQLRGKQFHHPS